MARPGQRAAFPRGGGSRAASALGAAILLATLAAFGGVARNGFVSFDDDVYLTANAALGGGLSAESLRWAFTATETGNWHPLTWISHLLDVQLFGLRPGPHHLVSLGIHAVNAVLLLALLRRLTGALWPSALVAALFALHPLHVESVAWAAERKDVLSTLFSLLAALAYESEIRGRGSLRTPAVPVLFALALMAKPMPVTLPLLLLLLDRWPLGRWRPEGAGGSAGAASGLRRLLPPLPLLREKAPLALLAAVSAVVTLVVQRRHGALEFGESVPLSLRLVNALLSPLRYLAKTLLPLDLAFLYPFPAAAPPWWVWGGALALLLAASALLLAATRRPWLGVGWLWYLVGLLPTLGFVQAGSQAMADRYTYLPLAGVFLAAAWEAAALVARRPELRLPVAGAALGLLAVLGAATRAQVGVWRDDFSLYRHALRVTERNWIAHDHLATALAVAGNTGEALEHYLAAVRIGGGPPRVIGNLAALLASHGDAEQAAALYGRILRENPLLDGVHYNLGVALQALGREDEAVEHYRTAVSLNPRAAAPWNNLGSVQLARGRRDEAIASFRRAVEADARFGEARFNLGVALMRAGAPAEALPPLQEAARILPGDLAARMVLADALLAVGRAGEAADSYRRALQLAPGLRQAEDGLARALARTGFPPPGPGAP